MTKDQVIYLRDTLYQGKVEVFFDNALLGDPNLDGAIFIWDDERELVHVITTEVRYTKAGSEQVVLSRTSGYEFIQAISCSMSKKDSDNMLTVIQSDTTVSSEVLEKYNKHFRKLTDEEIVKNNGKNYL